MKVEEVTEEFARRMVKKVWEEFLAYPNQFRVMDKEAASPLDMATGFKGDDFVDFLKHFAGVEIKVEDYEAIYEPFYKMATDIEEELMNTLLVFVKKWN